ncbi:MAG TPA: hypothetical protein VEY07_06860, partial [Thermoplasmata archaeon]|nr:hypothetical protein [Thermoplasmata archaeon]
MTRLELESQLLHGFRFECLPGCGLCCFAEPAVDPEEAARLKARFPGLTLLPSRGGFSRISSRPNGGACSLLE